MASKKPRKSPRKSKAKRTVKRAKRVIAPLRAIRLKKKFTRPDLAKKSGLSPECIRNIELRGASPQLRTLRAIAKALDVPVTKLVA